MGSVSKTVCVIGAGASGLTAIKCCLDEEMDVVCYERSNHIGGLWYYKEELHEGACTYKSTVINTSKEMMAFSDFPPPAHFANFMHNSKLMEYFTLYCQHFNLRKHINFETEVMSCEPSEDFTTTGRWVVVTKNLATGHVTRQTFDGVMVAVGHHARPHFPKHQFEGLDKFRGQTMHSHDYRTPVSFSDKRVMVVGIGNSGGDIAVETSGLAKQVYLSTRRGCWVINRVSTGGMPIDFSYSSRFLTGLLKHVPSSVTNSLFEYIGCSKFNHEDYRLKPAHRFLSQHPMVNDDLPNRILSGRVVIKGDIQEFAENGVVFKDDPDTVVGVDAVVFATGYEFKFPFIDDSVLQVKDNSCDLYKHIWPLGQDQHTLAVIGLIQPLGAINPIAEIQSRWVARVIKGSDKLPSEAAMKADTYMKRDQMKRQYYKSQRHTIQVDYVTYMDEIADQFGVKPKVWKLFLEDPSLAMKVLFGPVTPYQYRLHGPGNHNNHEGNNSAAMRIAEQTNRVMDALKTKKLDAEIVARKDSGFFSFVSMFLVVFLSCLLLTLFL